MTTDDMAATYAAAFGTNRPWAAHEFASFLENGAFVTGNADCFALVRVVLDEAELLTIATHPTRQGQGLARAVMAQWLKAARKKGASRAFLEVAADNARAIMLYRLCGFEMNGVRRGYYLRNDGAKCDALMMSCALN